MDLGRIRPVTQGADPVCRSGIAVFGLAPACPFFMGHGLFSFVSGREGPWLFSGILWDRYIHKMSHIAGFRQAFPAEAPAREGRIAASFGRGASYGKAVPFRDGFATRVEPVGLFQGRKGKEKRTKRRICRQIGKVFGFPGTCGAEIRGPPPVRGGFFRRDTALHRGLFYGNDLCGIRKKPVGPLEGFLWSRKWTAM